MPASPALSLAEAAERFRAWREATPRPRRVPEEFWELAAKLASVHGISKTARRLSIDYYRLKHRVAAAAKDAATPPSPAFVEVALDANTPGHAPAQQGCVVELADGDGRRLRMELPGHATAELAALARSLWETGR